MTESVHVFERPRRIPWKRGAFTRFAIAWGTIGFLLCALAVSMILTGTAPEWLWGPKFDSTVRAEFSRERDAFVQTIDRAHGVAADVRFIDPPADLVALGVVEAIRREPGIFFVLSESSWLSHGWEKGVLFAPAADAATFVDSTTLDRQVPLQLVPIEEDWYVFLRRY